MNPDLREGAASLVSEIRGRRVLVVGDVMLDRFIWGEVERISPEAPVPVVRVRRESARLGGAANVAANLASLGARPRLVGLVGADAHADRLREKLDEAGVDAALVEAHGRATTVKTRVIARAQQVVRVDREDDDPLDEDTSRALVRAAVEGLDGADAVVVSDYDKGVVHPEVLQRLLPEARRRALPVVVDPKLVHFPLYQPVTVLTPNQAEAARATALVVRTDADCVKAAEAILERLDTEAVLVTRGERGMLLLERGRAPCWIAATAREVYDVTGAGDTVCAALAAGLSAGSDLRRAAFLANHAAGVVVGKVGTATIGPDELLQSLRGPAPGNRPGPAA